MSKNRIRHHYEKRLRPNAPGFEAGDWSDRNAQTARFAAMAAHVDLGGKKLLDIGSGVGDLVDYLREHAIDCDYLGIDLLESIVAEAQRRHPDAAFLAGDVFDPAMVLPHEPDIIFASGIFNLDVGNNRTFLPAALERLASLATETLVFNLLHARTPVPDQSDYCVYWDPNEVRTFLPASSHVEIVDDYLLNDFTMICRK
jgi:SAM-dependent methyltransferase